MLGSLEFLSLSSARRSGFLSAGRNFIGKPQ
jgi:hypothetical protein